MIRPSWRCTEQVRTFPRGALLSEYRPCCQPLQWSPCHTFDLVRCTVVRRLPDCMQPGSRHRSIWQLSNDEPPQRRLLQQRHNARTLRRIECASARRSRGRHLLATTLRFHCASHRRFETVFISRRGRLRLLPPTRAPVTSPTFTRTVVVMRNALSSTSIRLLVQFYVVAQNLVESDRCDWLTFIRTV
jgi:hypothetical protein